MGQKLKFVLSDLHIGAGYANEEGNALEDFTASQALVELIHAMWHESERDQREIELIINGDLFEFLQVPAVDNYDPLVNYPKELFLDSSEDASIKRLNIIIDNHPDIFNALSDFMHVENPQRRITVIKGNHDVHLYWPRIKKRLREILGASGTRASLLNFANEFISREKIYVEHGHQRAEKVNGYQDPYDPRLPNDPSQLYYPIGSHFVIDFLNDVERHWWFADNIKPVTTLIWYALLHNFELASQGLISFIQHASLSNHNALVEDLQDSTKRQEIAEQYASDPLYRQQFHQQIQQFFSETHSDHTGDLSIPAPETSDDPVQMGQAYQKHQQNMLEKAAEYVAKKEGAKIILFGHTHHASQKQLQNETIYINTGSWIENIFDVPLETWKALFTGLKRPGDTPAVLPYARIDYDEANNPTAKLLFYEENVEIEPQPADTSPQPQSRNFLEKNFHWLTRFLKVGN